MGRDRAEGGHSNHCQILPLSLNFEGYRRLQRAVELRNLLGNYDKLLIPRGVCNQQVVGSNPTAGLPSKTRLHRSAANVLVGHFFGSGASKNPVPALLSLMARPFLSVHLVHLSFRIANPFLRRRGKQISQPNFRRGAGEDGRNSVAIH